jgi:hypothetical protein
MRFSRTHCFRFAVAVVLVVVVSACAATPYRYEPLESLGIEQRAVTQDEGAIRISASVPSDEEAKKLFGIPLDRRGIQAVWLEVTNNSDVRTRVAPYSIDPDYFPPHEVAYMYRKQFSRQGWLDMEQRFFDMSMPRHLEPGETVSGFVFTNAQKGTKSFNVDVYYTDGEKNFEHFTFFIEVPGFRPDHAEVDFRNLYSPDELIEVDTDTFRTVLADLPCCTTNSDGSARGQPMEVLLVAEGIDLLQALLRSGWQETGYQRSPDFLSASDYFYGRPPDSIFRKGRDKSTERNEMGLWLTPILVDGITVWAAQIKHAIGRRFQIEETFLGVRLDPDINDGRNFLMQNLWYSGSLKHYAWSDSGLRVAQDSPALDFNENAWFSDGYRLVLWVSGEAVSLSETSEIVWDQAVQSKAEQMQ